MRIVILGAGGIGGYLGARLIAAGAAPRFLLRPQRADQLRHQGLRLLSPLGDMTAIPQIATPDTVADLVILACKGHDLPAALDSIAPVLRPGSAILPFLNGIAHLDMIAGRFPAADLLGGVAQIGVTMEPDGTIRHLGRDNRFWFGPLHGAAPDRGHALRALLAATVVEAELRPGILDDLWAKYALIGTLAGATCLCRARIGTILRQPDGAATIRALHGECRAIIRADHPQGDAALLDAALAHLTDPACDAGSSMLRDMLAGRKTEHDHLFGDLLRRARRHRLATPLLAACHTLLACQSALAPPGGGAAP